MQKGRTWTLPDMVIGEQNNMIQLKRYLNCDKYKEMVIDFKKNEQLFPAISVDSKDLELVNSVKILGVSISNNLQWNVHATEVIKRANKRFYFLVLLKKKNFYYACLRPVLEYCAVVFHHTLNCFQNTFTPPATSCLQIISSTLK